VISVCTALLGEVRLQCALIERNDHAYLWEKEVALFRLVEVSNDPIRFWILAIVNQKSISLKMSKFLQNCITGLFV
jgi:hypothetical protein